MAKELSQVQQAFEAAHTALDDLDDSLRKHPPPSQGARWDRDCAQPWNAFAAAVELPGDAIHDPAPGDGLAAMCLREFARRADAVETTMKSCRGGRDAYLSDYDGEGLRKLAHAGNQNRASRDAAFVDHADDGYLRPPAPRGRGGSG
jgi:hypothetical protein